MDEEFVSEDELRAEVLRLRAVAEDLDRTARALRESEQRLAQLVHQCPIAVIEWDTGFRVVEWNAAAERIFGYSRDEMLGEHARRIIPREAQPHVDRIWDDLLTQHGGMRSRNDNVTADDERIICEWYNGPRLGDDGHVMGVISLAQDVTAIVRDEEERRRLRLRMVEAAKLESLGVLAGGVAHDFNNLLVGIVGATSLALDALPSDSPVRSHLEIVASSADRAAELTRQMLAYSGKGRFVVEPVDLRALVEEMARLVRASISKDATVEFRPGSEPVPIEGDATQLRQVIMNLILNASDAVSRDGGRLTISTGVTPASSEFLRSTWLSDDLPAGDYAYVQVADTGEGMDEDTRSRIFEPFFSTKPAGHGLGLAAVQGIVRGHRGFVEVESIQGEGTRIRVGFPARPSSVPSGVSESEVRPDALGFGTILLVDDEPVVREIARSALEADGFEVVEASDGREAVEAFSASPERFRALLVDLTMPKLSGDEVLRRVHVISPETPVILMSGFDESDVTPRFGGTGPSGFLQKPFRADDIRRALRAVLGF